MAYFTEDEVRKCVETLLRKNLSIEEWKVIKPLLIFKDDEAEDEVTGFPSDVVYVMDEDIESRLPTIKDILRQFRNSHNSLRNDIISYHERAGNETYNDSILLCELFREELRNNTDTRNVLNEAKKTREQLRFGIPIPLKDLKKRLHEIGAIDKPSGYPLPYPIKREVLTEDMMRLLKEGNDYLTRQIQEIATQVGILLRKNRAANEIDALKRDWYLKLRRNITALIMDKMGHTNSTTKPYAFIPVYFWDIKYLFIPTREATKFRPVLEFMATVSLIEKCHPALALASLFCDLPLFPRQAPKLEVVRDRGDIQIFANSPFVSPKAIARQFSEIRKYGKQENKEINGIYPRPRRPKRKTLTLLEYVSNSAGINWDDRREKWNKENHDWQYESNKKMQIAYYKARARISKANKTTRGVK